MPNSEEVARLYRIMRTLMQMLKDRGYIVTDDEINMTKNQFIDKYGENIKREDLTVNKARDDGSDEIYVLFPKEPKVKENQVKSYLESFPDKVFHGIFVVQQNLTPLAKSFIDGLPQFRIEVFQEAELLVNITENILVPKHQLLTDDEKKSLLERYTVKETQLPRILLNDPVARYYGLKRGQVVKIIRPSETADFGLAYRCVV